MVLGIGRELSGGEPGLQYSKTVQKKDALSQIALGQGMFATWAGFKPHANRGGGSMRLEGVPVANDLTSLQRLRWLTYRG